MTLRRTLCQEAHELLLARQEAFGDLTNVWHRIAEDATRRTGGYVATETALWVHVELHLERALHQPDNVDHLREAILHLSVLAQVRADRRALDALLAGRTP